VALQESLSEKNRFIRLSNFLKDEYLRVAIRIERVKFVLLYSKSWVNI